MEGQPSRPNQLITTCGGGDRERNRENSPERPIVEESRLPPPRLELVVCRSYPPVAVVASACRRRRERLWPSPRAPVAIAASAYGRRRELLPACGHRRELLPACGHRRERHRAMGGELWIGEWPNGEL
jgi:hypothetical protein